MAKPIITIPADLLKSVTTARPADQDSVQPTTVAGSKSPAPKVKPSTRPVRSTVSRTRSTNRGK